MTNTQVFYTGPIVKRSDARERGLNKYFTGKPCKYGHVAQRYVGSSNCVECYRSDDYKKKQSKYASEYWSMPENKARAAANRYALRGDAEWVERRREYVKQYNSRDDVKNRKAMWQYEKSMYPEYRDRVARNERIRNSTPDGKVETFIRNSLRRCLCNSGSSSMNYTASDLRSHITDLMKSGMSWDNYGEWHIDHIVPISWFIKAGVTDVNVINKLSNLRPLWAKDNLSKGGF